MKSILVAAAMFTAFAADASTWYVGGVWFGNICRSGGYYTVYPRHMGQPVGTTCPVRDSYGNVVGTGVVTDE